MDRGRKKKGGAVNKAPCNQRNPSSRKEVYPKRCLRIRGNGNTNTTGNVGKEAEFNSKHKHCDGKESLSSDTSHRSEQIPFTFVDVTDGRYEHYLPTTLVPKTNRNGSIDSSDESDTTTADIQSSIISGSHADEYNFTAEDENRLLASSNEEYGESDTSEDEEQEAEDLESEESGIDEDVDFQDDIGVLKSKSVIITSGNNITIRAFSSNISKPNIAIPKKKVYNKPSLWQEKHRRLRLERYYQLDPSVEWPADIPPRLFLNDIGYQPVDPDVSENIGSSVTGTILIRKEYGSSQGVSSERTIMPAGPPFSNCATALKVTCGKQQRVCESIFSGSANSRFKVPSLPPVKRPPSRPKKSDAGSSSSSSNISSGTSVTKFVVNYKSSSSQNIADIGIQPILSGQRRIVDHFSSSNLIRRPAENRPMAIPDEDCISIVATTLGDDEDIGDLNDFDHSEIKAEPDAADDVTFLGEKRPFVENWVENLNSAPPTEYDSNEPPPVLETIQERPVVNNEAGKRRRFKDVPKIFNGLCYYKYINGACNKKKHHTKFAHVVQKDVFINRFRQTSAEVLLEAYEFTTKLATLLPTLYADIYPCFLLAFGHHKLQKELISCIKNLFDLGNSLDVSEGIEFVVKGLEISGLTFLEAVEKISNVGFFHYPLLAHYLLQIMSRKPHLEENWEIMKRLIKECGHIPSELAKDILVKATSRFPCDRNICKDVYTVIVANRATEDIEEKYLIPFRTLLNSTVPKEPGSSTYFNAGNAPKQHINNPNRQMEIFQSSSSNSSQGRSLPEVIPNRPIMTSSPQRKNSHHSSPLSSSSRMDISEASSNKVPRLDSPLDMGYVPQAVSGQPTAVNSPTLMPSIPIVGKVWYRKSFQMNVSLHNLLPETQYHLDINETDVSKLNDAIVYADGESFMQLLYVYKRKETLKKFITMTLANLTCRPDVYQAFMELFSAIGDVYPSFATDLQVKGIFEVIVMNLLFILDKKGSFTDAALLLEKFCDWDSLISSQVFSCNLSHMGRYIYLAKLLVNGSNFQYAYEILQCPTLHLLEKPDRWMYPCMPSFDLEYRNGVLDAFFKKGYEHDHNFLVVLDMYLKSFKYGEIYDYGKDTLNPMLIQLINDKSIEKLQLLIENMHLFYKKMDRHVLRGYLVVMSEHCPDNVNLMLFDYCCERQIYTKYQGDETTITIPNNRLDVELRLIFLSYFKNLMFHKKLPPGDVIVKMELPDSSPTYPSILQGYFRSAADFYESVKIILKNEFKINANDVSGGFYGVIIKSEQISSFVRVVNVMI